MNARYLERYEYGLAAPRTDADVLEAFLRQEHKYTRALKHHHQKGNEVLFRKVDRMIEELT